MKVNYTIWNHFKLIEILILKHNDFYFYLWYFTPLPFNLEFHFRSFQTLSLFVIFSFYSISLSPSLSPLSLCHLLSLLSFPFSPVTTPSMPMAISQAMSSLSRHRSPSNMSSATKEPDLSLFLLRHHRCMTRRIALSASQSPSLAGGGSRKVRRRWKINQ